MTFIALFRVLRKENFSLKRLFGFSPRDNKLKTGLIALAILYAIAAMILSFGFMFFDLGATLKTYDQTSILLNFIYVYAFVFIAMMVLLRANSYLFQYRDYQILGSLPIAPRIIMAAKLSIMLLVMYVPTLFIIAPIAFSYFFHQGLEPLNFVMFILGLLTVPLLPIAIVSFVSLLIARISARLKHRNIINIVLSILIFLGYITYTLTTTGQSEANPLLGQVDAMSNLSAVYWPLRWFVLAVHQGSWVDFLLLVSTHIGIFLGFIFLVARLAIKTNQLNQITTIHQNNGQYRVVSQSVHKSLIQKEFRKFFSVPLYAMNSGIGILIMLIFAVISLFYVDALNEIFPMLNQGGISSLLTIIIFAGFCVSMTYTPAISLSLEGKNIWILKSLPIEAKTIVVSKIVFNLLLVIPATLIAILLFAISLSISWLEVPLLFLWALTFGILISVFDALLNLLFPKLNFTNEVEVIKQSIASLFAVFGGFTFLAINGLIFYFLLTPIGEVPALLTIILINVIITIPIALLINKRSAYYFSKI